MSEHALVCACGRRYEYERSSGADVPYWDLLRSDGHDPAECSRRVGFEHRFEGRSEMVEVVMRELLRRRTLSAEELSEIRHNLDAAVVSLRLPGEGEFRKPLPLVGFAGHPEACDCDRWGVAHVRTSACP